MQMNDAVYYVYLHVDPYTEEVVYVGKGCHGRAWDVTRNRKEANPDHEAWMQGLSKQGSIPSDWVEIIARNLTEKEAYRIEKEYMHTKGQPLYNHTSGEHNHKAKLTDEQAREIYILCKNKADTHNNIANQYGVSRTAVSMIASRKQWRAATACLISQ